jgi:hypothetical protein
MLTSNFRRRDDRLEQRKAMSSGGRVAPFLKPLGEVEGQDAPTAALPVNAHKVMGGQGKVPRLPSFK